MKKLSEYINNINESLLDDEDILLNSVNLEHSHVVAELMLKHDMITIDSKLIKDLYERNPRSFINELVTNGVVKASKQGSIYNVDLNFGIKIKHKDIGWNYSYISTNLSINKKNENLPIIINNITANDVGIIRICYEQMQNINVNFLPKKVISCSRFEIWIKSKRYLLDLSKRSEALSDLNGCKGVYIVNDGGVTADLIKWNNNPVPCNLFIMTKFDDKTVLDLPTINGYLSIGKTGLKYYMNKLNLFNNQNMIKQVFGTKCVTNKICE